MLSAFTLYTKGVGYWGSWGSMSIHPRTSPHDFKASSIAIISITLTTQHKSTSIGMHMYTCVFHPPEFTGSSYRISFCIFINIWILCFRYQFSESMCDDSRGEHRVKISESSFHLNFDFAFPIICISSVTRAHIFFYRSGRMLVTKNTTQRKSRTIYMLQLQSLNVPFNPYNQ